MQFFDRRGEPPPEYFRRNMMDGARRKLLWFFQLDYIERKQTRLSAHTLELKDGSVFDGLERLFRGKCAFCETQDLTHPYRFRPQASATPEGSDGHLYYTWLANAWENIYPICLRCVPRQPEYFPVSGKRASLPDIPQLKHYIEENLGLWRHPIREVSLLLDPCRNESFHKHFFVSVTGHLLDKSVRGDLTIEHFNLNRDQLVVAREAMLRKYRSDLFTRGITQLRTQSSGVHPLFDFANMEFGGLWYLQCRLIAQHLSERFDRKSILSRSQIGNSFRILCRHKSFESYQESLFNWIENEDFGRRTRQAEPKPKVSEIVSQIKEPFPIIPPPVLPSLLSIELTRFKAIDYIKLQLKQQPPESRVSNDPIQAAMLILGENATGKSTILEATALGLSDPKTRSSVVPVLGELIFTPGYLGAPDEPAIGPAEIRLTFDDGTDNVLQTDGQTWKTDLAALYPPVFAYGAFRQYQKSSAPFKPDAGISNLFDSASLLPDPEPWLLGLDEKQDFHVVARALRIIMAVEGDLDVLAKSADGKRCLIITRHGAIETATPLSHASSGYRSVLAMVCDIMRRLLDRDNNPRYQSLENARAIVLIDEVEAHLHPRWKIQIMGALRKALPKVTFISTSHDPLCVRGMHDGEVVVVHRTAKPMIESGTKQLAHIEQLTDLPDITQLTVEQLLTSDFFSLASTDQPLMNLRLGKLAGLLSASYNNGQLEPDDQEIVKSFKKEINDVLPVGSTQGQRIVQEAVALFLQQRITASRKRLKALDENAKRKILDVLEGF
jgi:hypothetical protein